MITVRPILRAFAFLAAATAALSQDTRLSNVSVRTSAGGADVLITGFTIGPGPTKQVLVRAAGPTLGLFGVGGTMADPKLELFNGAGVKIAENDNFNPADAATFASVGAFPLSAGAKDAALVATLAPGGYTAQISGLGATPTGVVLVEVYEISGGAVRLVNLSTRAQVGTGTNILIPGITISAGTGSRRLLIRAIGPTLGAFGVAGTIVDPKLELYSGPNKIAENDNWGTPTTSSAADAATLTATFAANGAFALGAGSKDAALLINLAAGSYTLQVSGVGGTTGAALVEVYDLTPANQTSAGTLYIAQLRPESSAGTSTASGYATILIGDDGTAQVSASFSNLSGAETGAHLKIGSDFVLNLPLGQVAGRFWTFTPIGGYTTADLIKALNTGNLTIGLDSAKYPGGEARGTFIPGFGSQTFVAPFAPPALAASALTAPSQTDAARFLTQATFGPTTATITALQTRGITGWIDDQMALPATGALASLRADITAFPNPLNPTPGNAQRYAWVSNWNAAWWKTTVTAPDQLRQRVALALSEILVVGRQDDIEFNFECMTKYYDLLVNRAFGNYRTLLEEVTLNPAMGFWLSHIHNQKADPVKGTAPDENYAREVQQLFTIGLVQLQPDGTLLLDATGQPIPTYDQAAIAETAKVFTGWSWAVAPESSTNAVIYINTRPDTSGYPAPLSDDNGWLVPMRYYDAFHDKTAKRIVSLQQVPLADAQPTLLPAGQTGPQDLKATLDALFNHPNTGPFLAKQLIQRLVTSNPSPAYVYRVAQVFANDGTGTRGNLGAVVRGILTDYEARSPDVLSNFGYGKIKEPLIRFSAFLRALNVAAPNGRYLDSWFGDTRGTPLAFYPIGAVPSPIGTIGQGVLQAGTVFNFFSPTYSPAGAMAAAGLVAPELEIVDSNFAIQTPNMMTTFMYRAASSLPAGAPSPSPFLVVDYSALLPNARNAAALTDQLNLLFCANQMTAGTRAQILTAMATVPTTATDTERVQTAIQFTITSPDSALQK